MAAFEVCSKHVSVAQKDEQLSSVPEALTRLVGVREV